MMQHIGQDFTSAIKLNLLPGISIPRGIYQSSIQYMTEVNGYVTMYHESVSLHANTTEDLTYKIGRDVRHIDFSIMHHNSYPSSPSIYYRYSIRVDHLILLNLACQLLKLNQQSSN